MGTNQAKAIRKMQDFYAFKPDAEIFETTEFNYDTIRSTLRDFAFLNKGLKIILEDKRAGREARDELQYNGGIVDVSYRYPKMFVIRPQFFIPLISLLRNAALSSLSYRRELSIIRDRECDLTNFEDNINTFKESFARNYRIASDRFKTAIEEIDKTILHLQKTKDALLSSENNLRIANNKADELSIKRLTRNAPTVRAMLEDIKHGEESK